MTGERAASYPIRTPRDDEVDVYGPSHQGKVRKDNQDHFLIASLHRQINVLYSNLEGTDHRVRGDARPDDSRRSRRAGRDDP